jgi:hypothetical protein
VRSWTGTSCMEFAGRQRDLTMGMIQNILRWVSYGLATLALAASVGLMIGNPGVAIPDGSFGAAVSAAPLLLVGVSFLMVQLIARPRFADLMKNLLLASTFLLWGGIQFMPQSALSRSLGNLVIALYVLDLAWMTLSTAILAKGN